MPVPTTFADLSTTVASNSPAGSENVFPNLDDYIRFVNAALASIRANTATNGWVSPYIAGTGSWAIPGTIGSTTPNTGAFTTLSATGAVTITNVNGASVGGFRNRVRNGNFGVNQRGVSGSVVLSAGAYGHDGWKAGASGCTYTFATSNNVTTLTISAGSLQQVIEGINLESGTYCMSWTGTATGKIGAGALSASGVTQAVTGGTDTTIEFSTGTLSRVQLEIGSATTFEQRPYATELAICQRYFLGFAAAASVAQANPFGTTGVALYVPLPMSMRVTPSISGFSGTSTFTSDGVGTFTSTNTPTVSSYGGNMIVLAQGGYTGLTLGRPGSFANSALFGLSAEA